MSMSGSQVRVVDPILTTHARGYKHADRVGGLLFPTVDVTVSAGKVIEFGKESFMLYNARRAPGGATKQVDFGYLGKPYELVQDSLDGKVPREFERDAAAVPGIWLVSREPGGSGDLAAGISDGVLAGVGFGVLFAAMGQVPEGAGFGPTGQWSDGDEVFVLEL